MNLLEDKSLALGVKICDTSPGWGPAVYVFYQDLSLLPPKDCYEKINVPDQLSNIELNFTSRSTID